MINERLKKVRKSVNLTQSQFGEKIGITKTAVSYLESGKSSLTDGNCKLICSEFKINESWLRTGEGEMFEKPSDFYELIGYTEGDLTEAEKRLLSNYLRMDKQKRTALVEYAKELFENQE